jgi:hypothetical protein
MTDGVRRVEPTRSRQRISAAEVRHKVEPIMIRVQAGELMAQREVEKRSTMSGGIRLTSSVESASTRSTYTWTTSGGSN